MTMMNGRNPRVAACVASALPFIVGVSFAAPSCDRACLSGLADTYLTALGRHDPKAAPLAVHVRFTENTAVLDPGEGLWIGASSDPVDFKIPVIDEAAGQIGLFAVLKENGRPVILIVRLKATPQGRITEVEQFVQRDLRDADAPGLVTPRPELLADVSESERSPRNAMIEIANRYFNAIEHDDGDLAPFADDCDRHESGVPFTNVRLRSDAPTPMERIMALGCRAQISSNVLAHINSVWPRGPMIVDQQKGLVMALPVFIHRGDKQIVPIRGVPGLIRMDTPTSPGDTHGGEILKIRAGQIHQVEVAGVRLPHGLPTGWPEPVRD
jgi:hypothetical protein